MESIMTNKKTGIFIEFLKSGNYSFDPIGKRVINCKVGNVMALEASEAKRLIEDGWAKADVESPPDDPPVDPPVESQNKRTKIKVNFKMLKQLRVERNISIPNAKMRVPLLEEIEAGKRGITLKQLDKLFVIYDIEGDMREKILADLQETSDE